MVKAAKKQNKKPRRDLRYKEVKKAYREGNIKFFNDIFTIVPEEIVAADLQIGLRRFAKLTQNPGYMQMGKLYELSKFIGMAPQKMFKLAGQK